MTPNLPGSGEQVIQTRGPEAGRTDRLIWRFPGREVGTCAFNHRPLGFVTGCKFVNLSQVEVQTAPQQHTWSHTKTGTHTDPSRASITTHVPLNLEKLHRPLDPPRQSETQ